MDFAFTEEQELLRRSLRELLARVCPPEYARACDEAKEPPREARRALDEGGWVGLAIPEEYGGQGRDALDLAILLEEGGRAYLDLGTWLFRDVCYGGEAILRDGTEEQKRFFLPRVARGELSFSFALTEPEAGSDAAAIVTRARREG
ncbi:MAG: acyl-CoA dehydrogenase family protein, partial [Nitrospinota bacterium]